MYVACPSCKTLYQIHAKHLHAAGGQVRCGSCRNTFNALEAVFDDPAQALAYVEKQHIERDVEALVRKALEQVPGGEQQAQRHQPAASVAEQGPAATTWSQRQQPDVAHVPEHTDAESPLADAVGEQFQGADEQWREPQAAEQAAPAGAEPAGQGGAAAGSLAAQDVASAAALRADLDFQAQPLAAEFVSRRQQQAESEPESVLSRALLLEDEYHDGVSHRAWGAIAASLLLIALLVVQYGYVERYRLAGLPQLRPVLEFGCQLLHCDLPLRRDIAKVEILEREVRDHPHVADALLISATFVNHAAFVQPYPVFSVSFSDLSGTPIAARRFRPDEYLPDTGKLASGMQAGERAQLMLELIDPGDLAVSFQFDFL